MSSSRNHHRTLATFALTMACAANPPPAKDATMHHEEDEPLPTEIAPAETTPTEPGWFPRWHEGDTWEVQYRVLMPSPRMSANPPPLFEEHDWRYTVDERTPTGRFHVSAVALGDYGDAWKMVYSEHGVLLEARAPREEVIVPGPGPLVPLGPDRLWRSSPEWPAFPLRPGTLSFEGGALTQEVTVDGGALTVTLVRRGEDLGADVTRTVVQRWEPDRPWWSTVRIDEHVTYEGRTFDTTELEGRVTSWTPAERGQP